MQIVKPIQNNAIHRFVYAGNVYMIKGDDLYKEIYYSGDTQLNGLFKSIKKAFKKVAKVVGKVVSNPVVGIALTAASGGAFGALSASAALGVNVAKGAAVVSTLVNKRNELKRQASVDKKNAAVYNARAAEIDKQILAAKGGAPVITGANPEATAAIQAYTKYINEGGKPADYNKNASAATLPNVTPFGVSTNTLMIGGFGLLGVILLTQRK